MKPVSSTPTYAWVIIVLSCYICFTNYLLFFHKERTISNGETRNKVAALPLNFNTAPYYDQQQQQRQQQCLSLDFGDGMDQILSQHPQVFIVTPSKAGGTTMQEFARQCGRQNGLESPNSAILSNQHWEENPGNLQVPSVISAFSTDPKGVLKDLVQHATRQSLIIYLHREETDRLQSAIKEVVRRDWGEWSKDGVKDGGRVVVDEASLIQVIKRQKHEIGQGVVESLSCDLYDAIADNAPSMIFANYKQSNRLQKLIAKHHCPELLNQPGVHQNLAGDKQQVSIRLVNSQNGGKTTDVSLEEWLHSKRNVLEVLLKMKQKLTCQAVTRQLEDVIYGCPDETIPLKANSFQRGHTTFH